MRTVLSLFLFFIIFDRQRKLISMHICMVTGLLLMLNLAYINTCNRIDVLQILNTQLEAQIITGLSSSCYVSPHHNNFVQIEAGLIFSSFFHRHFSCELSVFVRSHKRSKHNWRMLYNTCITCTTLILCTTQCLP
jgi:hypothetical protein